ncbi:hypothetical protein G9A89_017524 [Geosiphon pyriformis]|nr:hypothetical protein G9A89_017524 [Geosiphon pyriformis]
MTQELILSQNGQHTRIPAMCDHFKPITKPAMLSEDEQSNAWMDVHMMITKFGKWLLPKSKKHYQKK